MRTTTEVFEDHLKKRLEGDVEGDIPFEYNHTLVKGDYAFLEWTAKGEGRKVTDGADGFVIKDGKIVMQTIHYTVKEA